jgi:hypothetical protein
VSRISAINTQPLQVVAGLAFFTAVCNAEGENVAYLWTCFSFCLSRLDAWFVIVCVHIQTVIDWKKPTTMVDSMIRLDTFRHHIQISHGAADADGFGRVDEILELCNCTDVRTKPYSTDEPNITHAVSLTFCQCCDPTPSCGAYTLL